MSEQPEQPLRVCYFGTYRANYNRNQMMIAGLRRNGVEVIECHETLWHGIEDRVRTASGGWLHPAFWVRLGKAYYRLLRRYRQMADYDVMVVGYPGVLDVFLARLLTRLRKKSLVWDVLMSVYLVAVERGLDKKNRTSVNLLRWLERQALRMPDMLIQDTAVYAEWLQTTFGVSADRFRLVPIGADDAIYRPLPLPVLEDGLFRVIYYGSFIPNHGVEYIIEAANFLKDIKEIQFELIGDGPDRQKATRLTQQYGLTNVEFIDWLDKDTLVKRIARAQVCLGAFSTTPQSLMTVHNKVYEATAMAKPIITGDSAAIRAAYQHAQEVYLCEREDGASLGEAIRTLWQDSDLRLRIAVQGYHRFKEEYGLEKMGSRFAAYLREAAR